MFEFFPIEKKSFNVLDPFADFDKAFWNDLLPRDIRVTQGFRTDVRDLGDAFLLESELPGYKKEDIKVSLDDKYLTISAERAEEAETEETAGSYIRKERFYGTVTRRFAVEGIKTDGITAEYKDGILALKLPKKTVEEKASRTIDIQ